MWRWSALSLLPIKNFPKYNPVVGKDGTDYCCQNQIQIMIYHHQTISIRSTYLQTRSFGELRGSAQLKQAKCLPRFFAISNCMYDA